MNMYDDETGGYERSAQHNEEQATVAPADVPDFDGATYDSERDHDRLARQLGRVKDLMLDNEWRTLAEISYATGGDPEASVSARLRDLRKPKFGGYVVERRARDGNTCGLFEYRVLTGSNAMVSVDGVASFDGIDEDDDEDDYDDEDDENDDGEEEIQAGTNVAVKRNPELAPLYMDVNEALYNARDVLSMCRVYKFLLEAVQATDTVDVYLTDRAMAHLALQMSRAGMPVDQVERERVGKHLREIRDASIAELRPYTEGENREQFIKWAAQFLAVKARKDEPVEGMLSEAGIPYSTESAYLARTEIRCREFAAKLEKKGVNYGAKVQQAAIMRAAGVPLIKTTEKQGLPKINKETLEEFGRHPAARAMLNYTLTSAALRTFIDGLQVGPDNRIHPDWSVHKITGRWGSSPNCFDGATEILTQCGWVRFDALTLDMKVAQFHKDTRQIDFVQPTQFINLPYEGEMVSIQRRNIDLLVTPDHRLLLGKRSGAWEDVLAQDFTSDRMMWTADGAAFNGAADLTTTWTTNAEVKRVPWNDRVYCVSVPSSYIVVRRGGNVMIVGQCQNWSKRAGGGVENLRRMIAAPEGFMFVGADQKQLEARLIAGCSQDAFLLDVFKRGADIHSELAGVAFAGVWPELAATYAKHKGQQCGPSPDEPKCKICKQRDKVRDLTKRLEYGAFYGGSPDTLWSSCVKDFPDLKPQAIVEFLNTVGKCMTGVTKWRQRVLDAAIAAGEIRSPILGRREVFPLGRVEPTVAYNFMPQSGGADLWALGAIQFCNKWDQTGEDVRLIHNGHDSVLILCRQELVAQVEKDVHECWEMEWNGVQFLMDCKSGKRWSEV